MSEADPQIAAEPAPDLPDGEYAIIEMMGHRTYVGRISEVERFGTKMLAIEPLFRDQLLPTVLTTGASIYQLTPCSREVARERQPKSEYSLPASVAAALPPALLPAPDERPEFLNTAVGARCAECGGEFGYCDCVPF
ncbi:MAG TPA: hypothetical protein VFW19_10805 [Allosphingosinicella sp.]|nr:hypothetical protein [Allosphingosinicella sp.]